MSRNNLHLLPDDIHIAVEKGTTISGALQQAGITLTHPCGCRGACGRCVVIADGLPVKACTTHVKQDMVIQIPDAVRLSGQTVLTNIRLYNPEDNAVPLIERLELSLDVPSLTDSVDDAARLREAVAKKIGMNVSCVWIEPSCLSVLPYKLRENSFKINVTIIYENNGVSVLSVSKDTDKPLLGVAIDIGTTTIALALCDLKTGFVLDTYGIANPQAEYGSDVISRIIFTEENRNTENGKSGAEILQRLVIKSLSDSIKILAQKVGINHYDIPVVVIAANTTMSHFLSGLPTDFLRREPYVPVTNEYPLTRPESLGLPILPNGRVIIIPSVSSYVGGDITAGVIATKINSKSGLNMLVDVGTNGEMVLAGDGFMVACSCSAGPAFEGSGISCGSRAVNGAIDNVYYNDGSLGYDVIGSPNTKASSVCGSGLISLLSALLKKGVINRSGRFTTSDKTYYITPEVSISESDVQNLIRSKAAIFAGMRVLAHHLELSLADLDKVLIAGGFGRSLNIDYAVNIGMFPQLDKSAFEYIGNSALVGALRILNDRTINANEIAASITNFELSVGNDFMDEFTKACFLPHTDIDFFN